MADTARHQERPRRSTLISLLSIISNEEFEKDSYNIIRKKGAEA